MESENGSDSVEKTTRRKYDDSPSSSSEEKYVSSKRYKYYSDSQAEYPLTNYANSSSGSEDDSGDDGKTSDRLALVKYYPRFHRNDGRYENDANESNLRSPRYEDSYENEPDWSDSENEEEIWTDSDDDLTVYIEGRKARKSNNLRGISIDFDNSNDDVQVFEEVPVSTNESQPIDPSLSHVYQDSCDVGDRFPVKIVETNSLDCISIAELRLRMSNRKIDPTSVTMP